MVAPLVVRQDELPRILFIEQLSPMIGKTPTTIRTCATNAKYQHLIPTPFKMPHSRRLCWYERDVLAWIDSHRPAPEPARRRRGRPNKTAKLAQQRQQEFQQRADGIDSHRPAPPSINRSGGKPRNAAEPARSRREEPMKKGG